MKCARQTGTILIIVILFKFVTSNIVHFRYSSASSFSKASHALPPPTPTRPLFFTVYNNNNGNNNNDDNIMCIQYNVIYLYIYNTRTG